MDNEDHSAGYAPMDCLILVSRILDNSIPSSYFWIWKGIPDIKRVSLVQPLDRRGRRSRGHCNPPSLPWKVSSFHRTCSSLASRGSGPLMLAWGVSCFPWLIGSHRST